MFLSDLISSLVQSLYKSDSLDIFYNQRKSLPLKYSFRQAKRKNSPLLLILHGNGNNQRPSRYYSPDYNILCPLDTYGHRHLGSWFLGEHGDFFVLDLLVNLVKNLLKSDQIKNEVYIFGSSMGGYAAIILGLLLKAHAVFAHIPQTNLRDSHWYQVNKTFIDFIFKPGDYSHPFRNLTSYLLTVKSSFPLFFLSFNRFDRQFYNDEHMTPFVQTLDRLNKNYLLLVNPCHGHNLPLKSAHYIQYFADYQKEIQANFDNN